MEPLVGTMERETGFEPATACLGSKNSTTELLPHSAPSLADSHPAQAAARARDVVHFRAPSGVAGGQRLGPTHH
jgi:hypothetical protein